MEEVAEECGWAEVPADALEGEEAAGDEEVEVLLVDDLGDDDEQIVLSYAEAAEEEAAEEQQEAADDEELQLTVEEAEPAEQTEQAEQAADSAEAAEVDIVILDDDEDEGGEEAPATEAAASAVEQQDAALEEQVAEDVQVEEAGEEEVSAVVEQAGAAAEAASEEPARPQSSPQGAPLRPAAPVVALAPKVMLPPKAAGAKAAGAKAATSAPPAKAAASTAPAKAAATAAAPARAAAAAPAAPGKATASATPARAAASSTPGKAAASATPAKATASATPARAAASSTPAKAAATVTPAKAQDAAATATASASASVPADDGVEGFVFVCNADIFGECQKHQLLCAAAWQLKKMKEKISPDTHLFLYNYSTETLYGTFVASGEADLNLVPGAFKGGFNAHVPVCPLDPVVTEVKMDKRMQSGPKSAAEVASIKEALKKGRPAPPAVQEAWGIEPQPAPPASEEPPSKRPRLEAPPAAAQQPQATMQRPAAPQTIVIDSAPTPAAVQSSGTNPVTPPPSRAASFTAPTPKFTTPRPKWSMPPKSASPPLPAGALAGGRGVAQASPQHGDSAAGATSPGGRVPGALAQAGELQQSGMSSPGGPGKSPGTYWEDLAGGAPAGKANGYVMHCANATQFEVFKRHLFGAPEREFHQMKQNINPGTTLYLLNFESRVMFGPFCATTVPEMNIVREAFHGRFRAQIRVATKMQVVMQLQLENSIPPGSRNEDEFVHLEDMFSKGAKPAPSDVQQAWTAPADILDEDSAAKRARTSETSPKAAATPGLLSPHAASPRPGFPHYAQMVSMGLRPGMSHWGSPFGMGPRAPGGSPMHGGLRPTMSSSSLGGQAESPQGQATPTNPLRGAEQLGPVDSDGRQYNLRQIVVNFANIGAAYASKVLKKDNRRGDRLFDWEGVRKCIKHLKEERGLDVVGVVYENLYGPDNGKRDVNGIPLDIRQLCSSIQETPKLTGKNQRSADDEMTIKCAYKRNCRFMDNDNYRDWLVELRDEKCRRWLMEKQEMLQMRYFFDTELGTFDTLDGNIPMGLLEKGIAKPVPSHLVGKC